MTFLKTFVWVALLAGFIHNPAWFFVGAAAAGYVANEMNTLYRLGKEYPTGDGWKFGAWSMGIIGVIVLFAR